MTTAIETPNLYIPAYQIKVGDVIVGSLSGARLTVTSVRGDIPGPESTFVLEYAERKPRPGFCFAYAGNTSFGVIRK